MSYSISLFVEKRAKGSKNWEMVGTTYLVDECKHILLYEDDDIRFSEDIVDDLYDVDDDEPLSKGIVDHYENGMEHYCVKVCPLDEYKDRVNHAVDAFNQTMKMCYKALGISCSVNDDDWRVLDTYAEEGKKYTGSGDIRKGYNQLTFPVDKDLMEELNDKTADYNKAMMWRGIFNCIETEWNAEYRLVFVRDY